MLREGPSAEVQDLMRLANGATEGLQQNVLRRRANAAKELAGFGAK